MNAVDGIKEAGVLARKLVVVAHKDGVVRLRVRVVGVASRDLQIQAAAALRKSARGDEKRGKWVEWNCAGSRSCYHQSPQNSAPSPRQQKTQLVVGEPEAAGEPPGMVFGEREEREEGRG